MDAKKLVSASALLLLSAACSGAPTVVNTDDSAPTGTPVAAPARATTPPSNAHLANAFHFAGQVDGATGYYFTTPSAGPATVLPFNRILAAAGFRCNAQEASGISCLSEFSGKGFTFSAEGYTYTYTYTDVPAEAP